MGGKECTQSIYLIGRCPVRHLLTPDHRVGSDAHRGKFLQCIGTSLLVILDDIVLSHDLV